MGMPACNVNVFGKKLEIECLRWSVSDVPLLQNGLPIVLFYFILL